MVTSPNRYSFVVHPLAYRDWLNKIPDNSVDAMQWSIMNINTNEPHYQVCTKLDFVTTNEFC